jgi:hypothetical protein
MTRRTKAGLGFSASLALVASLPLVATADRPPDPLDRLAWLAGCWERRSGTRIVEEQWMAPRGGLMLGMSRTVDGERTREYEQTLIRASGERLEFIAQPSGQQPASFMSIELTASRVVFENAAHDFPQRVIYERTADGALAARIEGERDGRTIAVDFPYERVDCDDARDDR